MRLAAVLACALASAGVHAECEDLGMAIYKKRPVDEIKEEIRRCGDLDGADKHGYTHVMWAVSYEHLQALRALIEAGADVNKTGSSNITPLELAKGKDAFEDALIAAGAKQVGCCISDRAIEKLAVRDAATLAVQNPNGLFGARSEVVASALLAHGADVSQVRSSDGWMPLHAQAQMGTPAMVRFLIAHGARVDARVGSGYKASSAGYTPLMVAAYAGNVETARALIEAGADQSLKDDQGQDARALAERRRDEVLQSRGDKGDAQREKEHEKRRAAAAALLELLKSRAPQQPAAAPVQQQAAAPVLHAAPPVQAPAPAPAPQKPAVLALHGKLAVLELRNFASELTKQNAQYFTDVVRQACLRMEPGLLVMTRENILVLLKSSGRRLEDCEGECEVDTGRRIGADSIVSGEIQKLGSKYKLTLRLHETSDGRLLSSAIGSGKSIDELDESAQKAAEELFRKQ